MISFDVLLLTCTFLFRSVNVCSFAFRIVSWNLVLADCDSSRSTRKISYAFPPTASRKEILLHFSSGKTYQILLHATEWVKPITFGSLLPSHLGQFWCCGDRCDRNLIYLSVACPSSASGRYCGIQQRNNTCSGVPL